MTTSKSFEALRRANPRSKASFAQSVDAAADRVRFQIATAAPADQTRAGHIRAGRAFLGVSAAGAALAAAATVVAVFVTVGTTGTATAAAAIHKAVTLSATSADQSGTVAVRMTHDGQLWASKNIRWNGSDIEITDNSPGAASSGSPLLVVNGILYDHEPDHDGWVNAGPVSSIDPATGTTPTEQLGTIREDVGGTTLRRIVAAMTGLTTAHRDDGSTIYSGTVASGQIARETGVKEGQNIRVFPFGYVAHGAAADQSAPLGTAVTVGPDGVIREIAVTWATWTYTVSYSDLGSTPPLVAPADATPLRDMLRSAPPPPSQ